MTEAQATVHKREECAGRASHLPGRKFRRRAALSKTIAQESRDARSAARARRAARIPNANPRSKKDGLSSAGAPTSGCCASSFNSGPFAPPGRSSPCFRIASTDLRFARQLSESQKYRLGQKPRQHGKHNNRFLLHPSLQDHGIKLVNAPRDFRKPAQRRRGLFEPLVHGSSTLEIERFARGFAIALKFLGKRFTGSRKRRQRRGPSPDRILLSCTPRNRAPDTSSSPNKCIPETPGRGES